MNVQEFTEVLRYKIQSHALKHFFTPNNRVIECVKLYNIVRASAARNNANIITNKTFITALRDGNHVVQLNVIPPKTTCCISNQSLESGKTLLIHQSQSISLFCVNRRFLKDIHEYYTIVHFDEEIHKYFEDWVSQVYKCKITKESINEMSETFLQYNNGSKVNYLYVKFNTICKL